MKIVNFEPKKVISAMICTKITVTKVTNGWISSCQLLLTFLFRLEFSNDRDVFYSRKIKKFSERQHLEIMSINSISLIMNLDIDMFLARPIHIFTV